MKMRWDRICQSRLPLLDLVDLKAEIEGHVKRQFAPEFSQSSYEYMKRNDYAIGDYVTPRLNNALFRVNDV